MWPIYLVIYFSIIPLSPFSFLPIAKQKWDQLTLATSLKHAP